MVMPKQDIPVTAGVRFLRARNIGFIPHFYKYETHGGTGWAASSLGVDEHSVIKTLVMESDDMNPFVILMHGDREVSTKQLARVLGVKRILPASESHVTKYTGFQVGGVSPFGTKSTMPVLVERTILELERIYINGGKRGFLMEMSPNVLRDAFDIRVVSVAVKDEEE